MSGAQRPPDPRSGVTLDLEIWHRMVTEMLGEGVVQTEVRRAQVELSRDNGSPGGIERAQMCALKALWMIQGAVNLARRSHQNMRPDSSCEAELAPWKQLEQRAGICVHVLDKLPEELKIWRGMAGG